MQASPATAFPMCLNSDLNQMKHLPTPELLQQLLLLHGYSKIGIAYENIRLNAAVAPRLNIPQ